MSSTYIIAELSANHNGSLDRALEIVDAIADCGANAVKLQTYTADTLTLNSELEDFVVRIPGSQWDKRTLHSLYDEAHTPWEWHEPIINRAKSHGLDWFSSPFDHSSVDFLMNLDIAAFKIASPEIVDLPLIEYVASKGRPIVMSTGMASLAEISEAVDVVRAAGVPLTLLKCTSAYPSPPEAMNLATIPNMGQAFGVPVGLSDHSLGIAVPVAAVALGATMIEKHVTLSRDDPGPDNAFSLEPHEFKAMVEAVRVAEKACGKVHYGVTQQDASSRAFRRSLYAVQNIAAGEKYTQDNVRSIRPGHGLPPKYMDVVLGQTARTSLAAGTPITWATLG